MIPALLHQKCFVIFTRIPISRNYKEEASFVPEEKTTSLRMCRYEFKCRKALWLQAREAVWSNGVIKHIEICPVKEI